MNIKRIVRLTIDESKRDAFIESFKENKEKIKNFDGCMHLELWSDEQDPNIMVTYSIWEDAQALETYRYSELFKGIWEFTKTCFAGRPLAWSHHLVEV